MFERFAYGKIGDGYSRLIPTLAWTIGNSGCCRRERRRGCSRGRERGREEEFGFHFFCLGERKRSDFRWLLLLLPRVSEADGTTAAGNRLEGGHAGRVRSFVERFQILFVVSAAELSLSLPLLSR